MVSGVLQVALPTEKLNRYIALFRWWMHSVVDSSIMKSELFPVNRYSDFVFCGLNEFCFATQHYFAAF